MNQQQTFKLLMFFVALFLSALATLLFKIDFLWQANTFWLAVLIAACFIPVVYVLLFGNFDLFEPVYPIAISTFIYYGIMVKIGEGTDAFWQLGIDYRSWMPKVLFLALLALIGFWIGYYGGGRSVDHLPKRIAMARADFDHVHRWSMVILAFFASLFILWIVIARVPLWTLWVFGKASYNIWKDEASGIQILHLFLAQDAFPACILLFIATRAKRHWNLTSFMLLAAITILFAGLGVRARVLLMVGSSVVFYYLERGKHPSIWQIVLGGFIVFFLIAGLLGFVRDPENPERGLSAFSMTEAWGSFVKGSIATTTAVYVRWTPVFGYEWGKGFLQILLIPIPSAFWPGKYQFLGESGIDNFKDIDAGAAAGLFTDFYVNFGPPGVVFGMALLALLCRRVYDTYKANPKDPFAQISLALLWGFLFFIYGRNLLFFFIFNVLYVFGPLWITRWLLNRYWEKKKAYIDRNAYYH